MTHQFVKNSDTTRICCNCGCITYCCRCCTEGVPKFSRWDTRRERWKDDVWAATAKAPPCVPGRPVPGWISRKGA